MRSKTMFNMKKFITILVLVIIITLGTIPFFLTQTAQNALSVCTGIISSLASLITLLIALLLYSKYGVEKSLVNKQTEVVLNLLAELKKVHFKILHAGGGGGMLFLHLDRLGDAYWEYCKDQKLLFSFNNYSEGLNNIWEITENIFLPPTIAEKMSPLIMMHMEGVEESKSKQYMKVCTIGSKQEQDGMFGVLNSKEITLQEFISSWKEVILISQKWLKEHSNISVDLNFEKNF